MSSLSHLILTHWKTGDCKDLDTNISLSLRTLFLFCYPFALCCEGTDRCSLNKDWSSEKEKGRPLSFKGRPQNCPLGQDPSLASVHALPQHICVRHQSTPRPQCGKVAHLPVTATEPVSPQTWNIHNGIQSVLGTRQPLWPQPLPALVRCPSMTHLHEDLTDTFCNRRPFSKWWQIFN